MSFCFHINTNICHQDINNSKIFDRIHSIDHQFKNITSLRPKPNNDHIFFHKDYLPNYVGKNIDIESNIFINKNSYNSHIIDYQPPTHITFDHYHKPSYSPHLYITPISTKQINNYIDHRK